MNFLPAVERRGDGGHGLERRDARGAAVRRRQSQLGHHLHVQRVLRRDERAHTEAL